MRAIKINSAAWMGLSLFVGSIGAKAYPLSQTMKINGVMMTSAAEGTDNDSAFDNLDIVDSTLDGKIAVLRVGSEVGVNNLLAVFAGLKNKTGRHLSLEIETIYKDKEGNPLNAGSWIPMTLPAHEENEYHSASISVQAVDFLIRVRRAHASGTAH